MDCPMKKTLIAGLLLAAFASFAAQAQEVPLPSTTDAPSGKTANDGGWTGSGELGYASTTGNSRTQNINAKLNFNQETDQWKNNAFLTEVRAKSESKVVDASGNTINSFDETANDFTTGASAGYKLDPRSYIVGAVRYDHNDFGAQLWQGVVSIGYGYIALKDDRNELSFEVGPGYMRFRPAANDVLIDGNEVPQQTQVQDQAVARGLIDYKFRITDNTSFDDTFLMEAGSKDTYLQNDAGIAVSMTKKLSLKLGFQVRHNTSVLPGIKKNDTLTTTNLVYNF
jgi:putative salt-induced outer membrane protein